MTRLLWISPEWGSSSRTKVNAARIFSRSLVHPANRRPGLLLNRRVVVIDIPALLQVIAEAPAFQTIFHLYPLLSYFTNRAPVRSVPWEGTLLAADAADVI